MTFQRKKYSLVGLYFLGTGGDQHEFDVLQNLAIKAKQEVRETLATIQLKKDEMDSLEKELTAMMGVIEQRREQTIDELDDAREKQVCLNSCFLITSYVLVMRSEPLGLP